jgi:hypothetical protein
MDKIKWCCNQKGGIKIIEPNERIGKEYLNNADSDFNDLEKSSLKWKNIVGYYACYNAFYAILQKVGIKCEIHDCTLEFFKFLKGFSDKQKDLINFLKSNRIGVQYYLQKPKEINKKEIFDFILTCKHVFNSLSYDEIQEIRKTIKIIINKKNKKTETKER